MRKFFFSKTILISLAALSLLLTARFASLLPTSIARAQEPTYDQINDIAEQLNCPTCAGLNLADCRTVTCQQWKGQIDDLLQEGYGDQEILDYFVARYGTQVLQEPPRSGFTLILWVIPVIGLLAGGVWLFYTMRGWSKQELEPVTASPTPTRPVEHPADPPAVADDYLKQVERDLGLDETNLR